MGVLAPVSAHVGPSAQPSIGTSGIFPEHVSAESHSNISPNPSEVISEDSVYEDFSFLSHPLCHSAGGRGVTNIIFIGILIIK